MLHKCANPSCSIPFRHLREGKLFLAETEYFPGKQTTTRGSLRLARRIEHYWLCDECSQQLTLAFDQERGMITVPLAATLEGKMPRPEKERHTAIQPISSSGA